jgi:hypothetical protein
MVTSLTLDCNDGYMCCQGGPVRDWLLLLYKAPLGPSARRVSVWRKLKRLGAVLLHDAVWVLPATERTREQFQWLAAEIIELEGEALVWEATLAQPGQAEALTRQFLAQVEPGYAALLDELGRDGADLAALSRRYQHLQAGDYFRSPLGETVRAALLTARGATGGDER